jgi:uncharacterized membrane protein
VSPRSVLDLMRPSPPATPLRRLIARRTRRPEHVAHPLALGLTALAVAAGGAAWLMAQRRAGHDAYKRRPDTPSLDRSDSLHVERTVTVMRPAMELYQVWRELRRLPEFMPHLDSVTPLDEKRSRWVARGPGGVPIEWEAELMADEPGRLIAWRSVRGDVDHAGSVRFSEAPANRGTEIKVQMRYAPPAGRVGAALATIFGQSGDRQVREDLRRFKQMMEAGEMANPGVLAGNGRRP